MQQSYRNTTRKRTGRMENQLTQIRLYVLLSDVYCNHFNAPSMLLHYFSWTAVIVAWYVCVLLIYLGKVSTCRFSDFIERSSFWLSNLLMVPRFWRWDGTNSTDGTANKQSHSTNIVKWIHTQTVEKILNHWQSVLNSMQPFLFAFPMTMSMHFSHPSTCVCHCTVSLSEALAQ